MAIKKYERSKEEEEQLGQECAGRFDEGKVRHDLIPAWALERLAEVYTYGAQKYDDNNWLKGMNWSKVQGPLERHYNKWKRGSIRDAESNCYHLAQVAWNAIALMVYQEFCIGIDDRAPVIMDMLPPELKKKLTSHWVECAIKGEKYNGLDPIKEEQEEEPKCCGHCHGH